MKNFVLIVLLFLVFKTQGQTFIGTAPTNYRQVNLIQNYHKIYVAGVIGKCVYPDFSANKAKLGVGIKLIDGKQDYGFVSIGSSINPFWNVKDNSDIIDVSRLHFISIDLLCTVKFSDRFWFFGFSDLINWETNLGIGYSFTNKKR